MPPGNKISCWEKNMKVERVYRAKKEKTQKLNIYRQSIDNIVYTDGCFSNEVRIFGG